MQTKLYYSNIFIGFNVFTVAFLATSASMLEAFSIAFYAFVVANVLDHIYEHFAWNKKRGLSMQFLKNHNNVPAPLVQMDSLDDMELVTTSEDETTDDEESKKDI